MDSSTTINSPDQLLKLITAFDTLSLTDIKSRDIAVEFRRSDPTKRPTIGISSHLLHQRLSGIVQGRMLERFRQNQQLSLDEANNFLLDLQNLLLIPTADEKSAREATRFLAVCSDNLETAFDIAVNDKDLPPGAPIEGPSRRL